MQKITPRQAKETFSDFQKCILRQVIRTTPLSRYDKIFVYQEGSDLFIEISNKKRRLRTLKCLKNFFNTL